MPDPNGTQSCVSCRRLKRRCTRERPSCSLCRRVGRNCIYVPPSPGNSNGRESHESRDNASRAARIQSRLGINHTQNPEIEIPSSSNSEHYATNQLYTAFFLDSVATRGIPNDIPNAPKWLDVTTESLELTIEEAAAVSERFFSTIHLWLPVVSQMRMSRALSSVTSISSADVSALLFSMQLLSSPSPDDESKSIYRDVKTALAACEQTGSLSIHFLAASILTALYEYGNGWFPVAYFTASHCSRIVYAMGLHDRKTATQLASRPDTWTEHEEQRRLWWTVMTLDRYIHLGFRFRPLATPSISPNELLPAADEYWDRGELAINPLLVMSVESATLVSPFARTCQAAHLLGKACQHANDHSSAVNADFHFQEANQLMQAVSSLLLMIEDELRRIHTPIQLYTAQALCFSTLLLLYDLHSCIEEDYVEAVGTNRGLRLEVQQRSIDEFKKIIVKVVAFGEDLVDYCAAHNTAEIPVFTLQCLYTSAATFAWYFRETNKEEHLVQLSKLRNHLSQLGLRWPVALVYLKMLAGTEYAYSGANFQ